MTEKLTYTHNYIPLSRDQLVERLRAALRDKRFEHVLRVEQTAIVLPASVTTTPSSVLTRILLTKSTVRGSIPTC